MRIVVYRHQDTMYALSCVRPTGGPVFLQLGHQSISLGKKVSSVWIGWFPFSLKFLNADRIVFICSLKEDRVVYVV